MRELENEMKRIAVLSRREVVAEEDLSAAIRSYRSERQAPKPQSGWSLKETVAELEKRMIQEALQACHQNQQQAAKVLGLSRQGLIKKMKRYGITSAPARHGKA